MAYHYVNSKVQDTGEHEIHKEGYPWFPNSTEDLGNQESCHGAVKKAKEYYSNVDECIHCSLVS